MEISTINKAVYSILLDNTSEVKDITKNCKLPDLITEKADLSGVFLKESINLVIYDENQEIYDFITSSPDVYVRIFVSTVELTSKLIFSGKINSSELKITDDYLLEVSVDDFFSDKTDFTVIKQNNFPDFGGRVDLFLEKILDEKGILYEFSNNPFSKPAEILEKYLVADFEIPVKSKFSTIIDYAQTIKVNNKIGFIFAVDEIVYGGIWDIQNQQVFLKKLISEKKSIGGFIFRNDSNYNLKIISGPGNNQLTCKAFISLVTDFNWEGMAVNVFKNLDSRVVSEIIELKIIFDFSENTISSYEEDRYKVNLNSKCIIPDKNNTKYLNSLTETADIYAIHNQFVLTYDSDSEKVGDSYRIFMINGQARDFQKIGIISAGVGYLEGTENENYRALITQYGWKGYLGWKNSNEIGLQFVPFSSLRGWNLRFSPDSLLKDGWDLPWENEKSYFDKVNVSRFYDPVFKKSYLNTDSDGSFYIARDEDPKYFCGYLNSYGNLQKTGSKRWIANIFVPFGFKNWEGSFSWEGWVSEFNFSKPFNILALLKSDEEFNNLTVSIEQEILNSRLPGKLKLLYPSNPNVFLYYCEEKIYLVKYDESTDTFSKSEISSLFYSKFPIDKGADFLGSTIILYSGENDTSFNQEKALFINLYALTPGEVKEVNFHKKINSTHGLLRCLSGKELSVSYLHFNEIPYDKKFQEILNIISLNTGISFIFKNNQLYSFSPGNYSNNFDTFLIDPSFIISKIKNQQEFNSSILRFNFSTSNCNYFLGSNEENAVTIETKSFLSEFCLINSLLNKRISQILKNTITSYEISGLWFEISPGNYFQNSSEIITSVEFNLENSTTLIETEKTYNEEEIYKFELSDYATFSDYFQQESSGFSIYSNNITSNLPYLRKSGIYAISSTTPGILIYKFEKNKDLKILCVDTIGKGNFAIKISNSIDGPYYDISNSKNMINLKSSEFYIKLYVLKGPVENSEINFVRIFFY